MNIKKVNQDHIVDILNNFDYKENQIPRIKKIIFNNHIENFEKYYHVYDDCKKINFVDEFYEMYKLDIQVRRILFSAISRFEISLKTRFATFMTQKYGNGSIWEKKNFSEKRGTMYLSSINWTIKRMQREYDFKANRGVFHNEEGKKIFFSNYDGLVHSTLGNVIHLIIALNENDKKLFNNIYFTHLEYMQFDVFLNLMNDFRNHIVHVGKIILNKTIFPKLDAEKNYKSLINNEFEIIKEDNSYSFIVLYYKLMGEIPTKTFLKDMKDIIQKTKYENLYTYYNYDFKINEEIKQIIGESKDE